LIEISFSLICGHLRHLWIKTFLYLPAKFHAETDFRGRSPLAPLVGAAAAWAGEVACPAWRAMNALVPNRLAGAEEFDRGELIRRRCVPSAQFSLARIGETY
jgi:hypothetical protein